MIEDVMMIFGWTPSDVTCSSRDCPYKDGYFPIRTCKLKRGPPGFQINVLCLGHKSKTMEDRVNPSQTQNTAILLVSQT